MNVSYRWLKALRPELDLSPEEMAEVLAIRGAPVEELAHLAPGLSDLVIARVEKVEKHPDADRLSVCRVDVGGEILQVVCGAPNVQEGGFYPFSPVGSKLPTGAKIRRAKIRGVESNGMLCSEAELELGTDDEGIMALEGEFQPGESMVDALALDDWRLDVEITANRGDLLSHVGIARELAPQGATEAALPSFPGAGPVDLDLETDLKQASAGGVTIQIDDPELCSRYLGAVIRGVKVGSSPEWLASRIRAAGSRPINNVVDATNYVLLELGQPLHAFDLAKLGQDTVVVRQAREGERLKTLDGVDRRLSEGMLAICDAENPVAIAGVMGGAESEVSEETTDVLLECALFDPKSVRATRNELDMSTDASFRFERGVDPESMELAVRRAAEIILATAGGTLAPKNLDVCPGPWEGLTVPLRPSRVPVLLGITLSPAEITDLLTPLGFRVETSGEDLLDVVVPGFRSYDVRREVDVLEEVARTYGYDRFPEDLGPFRPGSVPDHPLFQLEDDLRNLLVGRGLFEAQTQAFASEAEGEVELSNPISAQEGFLRTALLPGLIRRVEHNFARGQKHVRIFEIGTVFFKGAEGELPREETRLAVAITGERGPIHWAGSGENLDIWDLKALMESVLVGARLGEITTTEAAPAGIGLAPEEGFTFDSGKTGRVGHCGRVDPTKVDAPAWAGAVWGAEVILPKEPGPRNVPVFEPLPPFPGTDRDLALLLPKDLPARQVQELIRDAAGPLLADLGVFDLYEGKGVAEGHRSVAFRLRFQSLERTLTDDEVERAVKAATDRLREELGVETRG